MNDLEIQALNHWFESIVIRLVNMSDLPSLEWNGEYTYLRNVYKNAFERQIKGKNKLWVAEIPQVGLIGQVFVQLISARTDLANGKDRAYLYAFRIKEMFRNRGVGSKILKTVEADLLSHDFKETTLNVARDNLKAIHFYQRHAYKIVSKESGEWSFRDHNDQIQYVVEPAWKMVKRLK
jgi:ribosomal protein S18 acetylase RimI-like enzyme